MAERGAGTLDQGSFDRRIFDLRLARSRDDLFGMLERLYGHRPDYPRFRDALIDRLEATWAARPEELKWLDLKRALEPDWFQRPDMAGYVFYIDRFAGTLRGVLDHLVELGITYVHFMPCLKPRPGDSDGGYSVMRRFPIQVRHRLCPEPPWERATATSALRRDAACAA
jgi:amylosucrase